MKKFRLTMMCTSCKWKIASELEGKGFKDFEIDMESSILTMHQKVNADFIIYIVNQVGYQIEELDDFEELTDEEIALFEDEMRNGYM